MENLKINWIKNVDDYYEKGLMEDFEVIDDQCVKGIIGYFEDKNGDEDAELIGYISCEGDIKQVDEDDLWEAFYAYFE
jgi:hypothetical protein